MTKVNKPVEFVNEQNSSKPLHKIWSTPVITDLINETSGKVDIISDDTINILSQEEIDALENGFIKMILDLKQEMINLINRKLDKLDLDSPVLKRVDEFVNGVINNVPSYESDYTMWNIIIGLPVVKGKKFGDFPRPYSALDLFQDNIKELEGMPDILKNPEENRPKLKEKVSLLRKKIIELSLKKLGKTDGPMWWFKDKIEELEKKLIEKFGEDRRKYYSWHAFAGSTPWKNGPHIYGDFLGESSVIVFMEKCIAELENMPDLIEKEKYIELNYSESGLNEVLEVIKQEPQFDLAKIEELYKNMSSVIVYLNKESKFKLGEYGGLIWWIEKKTQPYYKLMQAKYPNISEYLTWNFLIGGTPWKGGQKFVDLQEPDSVVTFLENCCSELENMPIEQINYYNGLKKGKKINFLQN